jgi:hypothetical protein
VRERRILAARDMFGAEDDAGSDGEVPESASSSPSWVALPDCVGVAEPFRIDLASMASHYRRAELACFDWGALARFAKFFGWAAKKLPTDC